MTDAILHLMMIYQEYLDGLIPITLNEAIRREDYYKKYMSKSKIRDEYDQYIRLEKNV